MYLKPEPSFPTSHSAAGWLVQGRGLPSCPAGGHLDARVHDGGPGCLASWRMASQVLEPRGPLLPATEGAHEALSWARTLSGLAPAQNQVPLPRWHEGSGHRVRAGRAMSALRLHALAREGRGVQGLNNYVSLEEGFCSEREAEQTCRFWSSRRKTESQQLG